MGVTVPTQVFTPGQEILVQWTMTIPHEQDFENTGVRIAVHYAPGDSFQQNILAGGVEGDGGYTPLSAGAPGVDPTFVQNGDLISATVTLPNKECDYCTLQWVWAARMDGGSYMGCADIAIKANGQLPNYAALPSQQGNKLNNVPAQPGEIIAAGPPPPPLSPGEVSPSLGDDGAAALPAAGAGAIGRARVAELVEALGCRRRRSARAHRGGAPLPRVT